MRKICFLLLTTVLLFSCGTRSNNKKNELPKSKWEIMDEGWTSLGSIATYRIESDGVMHCCSDCARLDYQVVNGETRYRIFYPLESSYYNVVKNPEYRTNSRYGNYEFKAGHYYLNL